MTPSPQALEYVSNFPSRVKSRRCVLWAVVFPVAIFLLQACTSSSDPPVEPWRMGEQKTSEILPYQKLRAKVAGWRLWEVASKVGSACVAIKVAEGKAWPKISIENRNVTGQGGFYMFSLAQGGLPYFGFYGKYGYPRTMEATINGRTIADVNDRDTVLGWDGQRVDFRVVTHNYSGAFPNQFGSTGAVHLERLLGSSPQAEASDEEDETTGAVDFSGVSSAYEAVTDCQQRIAGSR